MPADPPSNHRARILQATRGSGHTLAGGDADIRREAEALLSGVQQARPPLLAADVVQAFKLRFQNDLVIGTTCEEIESLAELSTAVRGYLERHRLPPRLKLQPRSELLDLDWSGLETGADVEQDDGVAVCLADYGIAETGSVVAHSGASMPMLLNFLPLHLIIAVMRPNILAYLDDYAALAAKLAANSQTPRTMCLITGASGTTDIEGVLVRGAHGPKFLHIVIAG